MNPSRARAQIFFQKPIDFFSDLCYTITTMREAKASPTEYEKGDTVMKTNCFEDTYVSVNKARKDVEKLDDVILALEDADGPLTCREIGLAVFGNDYIQGYHKRSLSCRMGQMLKHLRRGGFIRVEEVNGEPVEVEYDEYQRDVDDEGNPYYIIVHDDEGNKYQMHNPKWRGYSGGRWVKIKKTVIPRIKVYSLVQ